ncbi:hypothetical protein [Streptomyces aureoversilis]|uniref:DNA-binding protein n=1 Tax=Streptomyces aureoversilis TaxID=67277 RepID=A0ABW0A8K3_9ACTN
MTQPWSVSIELDSSDMTAESIEETIESLMQSLATHEPSVRQTPSDNVAVRLFVEADDALTANAAALEIIIAAARALGISERVTGLEVMSEEALDEYIASPLVPPLAGITEIATICNASSKQRAKQLTELKGFPPPVQVLAAGPVYVAQQVEDWNAKKRNRSRWPAPAELTDAERAVLLALVAAGRGEELPKATDVQERTIGAVEATYSPTHMLLHFGRAESDDIRETLSDLSDKSLVATRRPPKKIISDAEHQADMMVAITAKGQRRASALH